MSTRVTAYVTILAVTQVTQRLTWKVEVVVRHDNQAIYSDDYANANLEPVVEWIRDWFRVEEIPYSAKMLPVKYNPGPWGPTPQYFLGSTVEIPDINSDDDIVMARLSIL